MRHQKERFTKSLQVFSVHSSFRKPEKDGFNPAVHPCLTQKSFPSDILCEHQQEWRGILRCLLQLFLQLCCTTGRAHTVPGQKAHPKGYSRFAKAKVGRFQFTLLSILFPPTHSCAWLNKSSEEAFHLFYAYMKITDKFIYEGSLSQHCRKTQFPFWAKTSTEI